MPHPPPRSPSLDDPRFARDACGVGFVASTGPDPSRALPLALQALERLEHRGGTAADGASADGAGLLTALPEALLRREAARLGFPLPAAAPLVAGVLFAPARAPERAVTALQGALAAEGLVPAGTRQVPVEESILGGYARESAPRVVHVLASAPGRQDGDEIEAACHRARKRFERDGAPGYVASLSGRTVVYKALARGDQLARFYPDLLDADFATPFAVFHRRYSTNTLPTWALAQPFRTAAHNGEINTLWGNRAWMQARTSELPAALAPILSPEGSDSACLDEALELLLRTGRPLAEALALLLVPAWEERCAEMPPGVVAFLRAHAPVMEPWDGPAALAFSDGRWVGAALDRNGLRPCRWLATGDGLVVAASETGVVDVDARDVVRRGRLGPGQVLMVDATTGEVLDDAKARQLLIDAPRPSRKRVRRLPRTPLPPKADGARPRLPPPRTGPAERRLWGLTREDVSVTLGTMASEGKDAVWSMGDDTPIAPLARAPRSVYGFLRQRFAQVTNPAMDSIREAGVMTLRCALGPLPSLRRGAALPALYELESPVLDTLQAEALRHSDEPRALEIACVMAAQEGALAGALDRIEAEAERGARDGASLILLSDRALPEGALPVPMALAVGAVHRRLLDAGLRARAGIVAEAGDCWDVHHLAVLLGFGAGAVHPWLALEAAREEDEEAGPGRLLAALETTLRKVMAKMGISTVSSYRGARLFDVLGLSHEVAERCFRGSPNALGGLGFADLEAAVLARAGGEAWGGGALPDHGRLRFRRRGVTERHAWDPPLVRSFQAGVGSSRKSEGVPDEAQWEGFVRDAEAGEPSDLRDLLDVVSDLAPLPIDDVEPEAAVVRRFVSAAMSLGALSPEAHQALTLAMNQLGARSNTGEGGEDPAWYRTAPGQTRRDGRVKQLASARFGVTPEYLARAEEIEIKVAQGAKPGEGGQLPARKVTALIARLRHASPGMPLISPPPHHDVYSIEDLAQLIYDLKRVNPSAKIGVKLVSEAGVGMVAAGVAKAWADYIVISGHSGGTGASPLSSIKHAGSPWELGLSETQQVLVRSDLRGRVRLRVDGGLRTGRDVVLAALLGAEEFGFGTAPLVALGCDMARQCHLDTCPTGIATQREDLRARFRGQPAHVVRYFLRLADQVRALLATLGFRCLDDVVGRVDLLRQVRWRAGLDLSPMLAPPALGPIRCARKRNDPPAAEALDDALVAEAAAAVARGERIERSLAIGNGDRAVGARIAGALALMTPERPGGRARIHFHGVAGQSFGAFCHRGMTLALDGEANDYVGKGMGGGTLVLRPAARADGAAGRGDVIAGNTLLYGATGGRLFAAGAVGERFAVRNSGATAVVEGAGDHACEYMTGGRVVILGPVGHNLGAGMTGGVVWVLDEEGLLPVRANGDWVAWSNPSRRSLRHVRRLVEAHHSLTDSREAADVLADWERAAPAFVEVRWTGAPTPDAEEEPGGDAALDEGENGVAGVGPGAEVEGEGGAGV